MNGRNNFFIMNSQEKKSFFYIFEEILLNLLLVSVFLIPAIKINESYPTIQISDFLSFFFIILLFLKYKNIFSYNSYIKFLILFSIYIFIVIILNNRLRQYRDYFEIMKIIKFGFVFIYITFTNCNIDFAKSLRVIFIGLLIFNLFHYLDIFGFNHIIEPFYSNHEQLDYFGLNTLGQTDVKRMLGTMGNPNNNSILFLFFAILFMPTKKSKIKDNIFFFLSYISILMCESRTGIVAFFVIFVLAIFLNKYKGKQIIIWFLLFISFYILLWQVEVTGYLSSLSSYKIVQSHSVKGRLEVWKHLWDMIKQKPIFGYGPYKEYFYENNLYSESEYILMTWRYGFIGLVIYILWIITPAFRAFKNTDNIASVRLILFSLVILITAITNNPLMEPRILVMFAIFIGLFYRSSKFSMKTL